MKRSGEVKGVGDYPGSNGEEGEGDDRTCSITGEVICFISVRPLIGQQAETHKPQECPYT